MAAEFRSGLSKIGQLKVTIPTEDVLRLQVSVDQSGLMSVSQTGQALAGQLFQFLRTQRPLLETSSQAPLRAVLENEVVASWPSDHVQATDQVRVADAEKSRDLREDLLLAQKFLNGHFSPARVERPEDTRKGALV